MRSDIGSSTAGQSRLLRARVGELLRIARSFDVRSVLLWGRLGLAVVAGLVIAALVQSAPSTYFEVVGDVSALGERANLDPVIPNVYQGNQIGLTDNLRAIDETVRIDETDEDTSIGVTPFTCHGGRARISWSVGNLEPTLPSIGIVLSARLNGKPIGWLLRGSSTGTYNDAPVWIQALISCPPGQPTADLFLTRIEGT